MTAISGVQAAPISFVWAHSSYTDKLHLLPVGEIQKEPTRKFQYLISLEKKITQEPKQEVVSSLLQSSLGKMKYSHVMICKTNSVSNTV